MKMQREYNKQSNCEKEEYICQSQLLDLKTYTNTPIIKSQINTTEQGGQKYTQTNMVSLLLTQVKKFNDEKHFFQQMVWNICTSIYKER